MAQAGTLCWSAVCRDGVTLAECGEDMHGGSVLALAKKILAKKPSPGWEFDKSGGLRACKFHVHDAKGVVWSACCVYTSGGEKLAKGFLEKIVLLTEPLRHVRVAAPRLAGWTACACRRMAHAARPVA